MIHEQIVQETHDYVLMRARNGKSASIAQTIGQLTRRFPRTPMDELTESVATGFERAAESLDAEAAALRTLRTTGA